MKEDCAVRRTVLRNSAGVSLVEVLISFVIFSVVSLALLRVSVISVDQTVKDSMRDEAVSVAETRMNEARGIQYSTLASDTADLSTDDGCHSSFVSAHVKGTVVTRTVRGAPSVAFCTSRDVTAISSHKQVEINVGWVWKGVPNTYSMTSIVRQR